MPVFDPQEGSALRRLVICFGAVGVFVTLVAIALSSTGVANLLPMRAEAAANDADWSFARPAVDEMNAAAIQVCSAEATARAATGTVNEAIRQAQVEVLVSEYALAEREYNAKVRAIVEAGGSRPWDILSKALPLELARSRVCLKVAVAPPKPPKALQAMALSLVQNPDTGPVWVPDASDRFITLEQLDVYAAMAGWPNEPGWWPEMRKIILCETRSLDLMAHNTSDPHGGSYGLAQLNGSYHFVNAGEDFARRFDPVVNLRTALWLRTARGHFGGAGGWFNCARLWGIE